MQDYKIEDTVLLIDTSRSMLRRDFKPNRLNVSLRTARTFIETKFNIDPKDRIAVISFGNQTKKLCPFSSDPDSIIKSLNKIQISGKGLINEGIAFALQLLVEEMRKIGGKFSRIFIISDDKFADEPNKVLKLMKIAKGLGVFIDSCQLGKTQDYKESTLKKATEITEGEFGYFTNSKAIINAGKAFASKKNVKSHSDYFSGGEEGDKSPLLGDIALKLRRPTVLEIRMMMSGKTPNQKCQICHSSKAPITSGDFYSEGRFCPSCDRPMHLSCAAMWAKKSEYKANIFRCPFCFFLLELPLSVVQLVEKSIEDEDLVKILPSKQEYKTIMESIPSEIIPNIDESCSYCNNIFLGDYEVFRCKKCGSYYHEPCLKKMIQEIQACRYCGAEIEIE